MDFVRLAMVIGAMTYASASEPPLTSIRTASGRLEASAPGVRRERLLGIPYVALPTGSRRWTAAEPLRRGMVARRIASAIAVCKARRTLDWDQDRWAFHFSIHLC